MSLGRSSPSHTSTVLCDPSRLATSMRSVPASVQYSFLLTQSMAKPAGLSKLLPTTTCRQEMRVNSMNVIHCWSHAFILHGPDLQFPTDRTTQSPHSASATAHALPLDPTVADLLPGAVPARPTDGVRRHVAPVHVVGRRVPVERDGAAQPRHVDHRVRLLRRVERNPPQIGASREEQERAQVCERTSDSDDRSAIDNASAMGLKLAQNFCTTVVLAPEKPRSWRGGK